MNQLAILSRDAEQYAQLLESVGLPNLRIDQILQHPIDSSKSSSCNILLADPNFGAQSLLAFPNLEWLQSTWAGVGPLLDTNQNNYTLTGIKDVFGVQMREYVFAYLLHFSRKVETYQNLKDKKLWQPIECESLKGKTIGILGMGSIGKEVAKTAKHFGMTVLALSRTSRDCQSVDHYILPEQLTEQAKQMDFVVLLLPDTDATRNLVDTELLNALPTHCVLINAGRGQVVNENALIEALTEKRIKAAVLDVFTQEPLPPNNPLWQLDNAIITQHTSAISHPKTIVEKFVENYELFVQGKPLTSEIDRIKGY